MERKMPFVSEYPGVENCAAWVVKYRANAAVAARTGQRLLMLPEQWLVVLLMHKAGVPPRLIAYALELRESVVRARLKISYGALMFAPLAAQVEAMMSEIPTTFADECEGIRQLDKERRKAGPGVPREEVLI